MVHSLLIIRGMSLSNYNIDSINIKGTRAVDAQPIEMGQKMLEVGCAATRCKRVLYCN